MKKKEKQKEKKSKKIEIEKVDISEIDKRFEITSKIDELKILAQNSYLRGDYHEAINYVDEIIRLAVQGDVQSYVKEQEKFINIIADKLQKEYIISEINDVATGILQIYEILIKTNKIEKAHKILEDFKNRYENVPDLESIPIVRELIMMDNREWIKYTSSLREVDTQKPVEETKEDDFDSMLDDIQKFLKRR